MEETTPEGKAKKKTASASGGKDNDTPAAKGSKDPGLYDLKSLVVNLKEEMTTLNNKIDSMKKEHEKMLDKVCVSKTDDARPKTDDDRSGPSDEFSLGHISEEEEHEFGEIHEVEDDYEFDLGLAEEKLGDNIDDDLAEKFNEGMIKNSSWDKSKKVMEKYPRPRNVNSLKTPLVNEELLKSKDLKQKIYNKDYATKKLKRFDYYCLDCLR